MKVEHWITTIFYFSLGDSTINKLAFIQRNTRQNPHDKKTTPIFILENFLKPRGYLKQTTTSTSKVYQPKPTQSNAKVPLEHSTLQEGYTQSHFGDTSTNKPEIEVINPEQLLREIKVETISTPPSTNKGKGPLLIPAFISRIPKVKVCIP